VSRWLDSKRISVDPEFPENQSSPLTPYFFSAGTNRHFGNDSGDVISISLFQSGASLFLDLNLEKDILFTFTIVLIVDRCKLLCP
jgi:hypothetical protein